MIEGKDLFDFSHSLVGERLQRAKTPWEALAQISAWICEIGAALDPVEYEERSPQVWVHRSAHIAPTAYLGAPCIVGPETEVRHCAFVRGAALIGAGCVVGNSTEIKNAILFDHVQVPHYNYIGDSILGYGAHLGAGAVTSNVRSDKRPVVVHGLAGDMETGRKKVGALVGDGVEIGCNSVLNPGTVIGRRTSVYPLTCVRGEIPADCIVKNDMTIVPREE